MKHLFIQHSELGAILSAGGVVTSFIVSAMPYLQTLAIGSSIFIAWYTFIVNQKNKKK